MQENIFSINNKRGAFQRVYKIGASITRQCTLLTKPSVTTQSRIFNVLSSSHAAPHLARNRLCRVLRVTAGIYIYTKYIFQNILRCLERIKSWLVCTKSLLRYMPNKILPIYAPVECEVGAFLPNAVVTHAPSPKYSTATRNMPFYSSNKVFQTLVTSRVVLPLQ